MLRVVRCFLAALLQGIEEKIPGSLSLNQLKCRQRYRREKEAGSIQGRILRAIDADVFADASPSSLHS